MVARQDDDGRRRGEFLDDLDRVALLELRRVRGVEEVARDDPDVDGAERERRIPDGTDARPRVCQRQVVALVIDPDSAGQLATLVEVDV